MKTKTFHISDVDVPMSTLANIQGFSPDLHECLISLGLHQKATRILDAEFVTNMGLLCTTLSIMATNRAVSSDWRFSRFGVIYLVDDRIAYDVIGHDTSVTVMNHAEFSLVIAIMACRENIIGALIQGHKNPFRISLFYQNLLLWIIGYLDQNKFVDGAKISAFLDEHKRKEFADHEPYFNKYLVLEVSPEQGI